MGALDDLISGTSNNKKQSALDSLILNPLQPSESRQEYGPIPTKEGLLEFAKQEGPELIGSQLGAFSRKTIPGAILSGIGSMAGEGIRQGFFDDTDLTAKQRVKKLAGAGVRGVFGEVAGRKIVQPIAKKVGKFIFEPFSEGVTAQAKPGIEAAKRLGITPPISAMTEAKFPQALERYAEYSWPFGPAITAQKKMAIKKMGDVAEGIKIASDLPDEMVASKVSSALDQFESTFKKSKDAMYAPINNVLADKPVNPVNTVKAIKDVLERRAGSKEAKSLLENWLERLQPGSENVSRQTGRYIPAKESVIKEGIPGLAIESEVLEESLPGKFIGGNKSQLELPSYDVITGQRVKFPKFNALKSIRTEIGSRGNFDDPGVTGIKSDLEYIYAMASKDMDNLASEFGMKDALDAVNTQYSTGIKKLQSSLLKHIKTRAEKSPENIHKLIFRNDSPTLVKSGRDVLGEDAFNQIRHQWFQDLLEKSKSNIEGETVISPNKLSTNIRKMGRSLDEMFSDSPELKSMINDLSETAKLLTRGQKVTHGSQSAYLVATTRNIRGALAAPLLRTDAGRQYLTTGFPSITEKTSKLAGRASQVGIQLGMQREMK